MLTGCAVKSVQPAAEGEGFSLTAATRESTLELWARTVLITTGGLSYSPCGTTGDGYPWAQSMGHSIVPLRPALTPLVSNTPWVQALSGLTLDDALVTAHAADDSGKEIKLERAVSRGGFLWTHTGCSGPTAMNVSRCFTNRCEHESSWLTLDLLPELTAAACEQWLVEEARKSNRAISTVLSQRVPRRLALAMLEQLGAMRDPHMAELPKALRSGIVESLKRCAIPIHGTKGYPKAEVTAGGVALGEVNFQDMQSRKQAGLFFAGEILDLDGPIGGFNFQAAWSTGHTAGMHLG
jgi:predicted Rossmann fold flavoprotein